MEEIILIHISDVFNLKKLKHAPLQFGLVRFQVFGESGCQVTGTQLLPALALPCRVARLVNLIIQIRVPNGHGHGHLFVTGHIF